MADKLLPSKVEVDLMYLCPKCKDQHWVTLKQAEYKGGFKIVCDCGTVSAVKIIKDVKLLFNVPANVERCASPTVDIKRAKRMLSQLGYSSKGIANLVTPDVKSTEDLVRIAIAQVNNVQTGKVR